MNLAVFMNGIKTYDVKLESGEVPIMLRSKKCHLYNLTEEQLVKRNEEPLEQGGYFICKGSEKVRVMLL